MVSGFFLCPQVYYVSSWEYQHSWVEDRLYKIVMDLVLME